MVATEGGVVGLSLSHRLRPYQPQTTTYYLAINFFDAHPWWYWDGRWYK
jgi:hypothetical protein